MPRTVPRRLVPVVLGLVVLLATGCADDVSPAIRVGDTRIGNTDLMDEVGQWVGNPMAVDPAQAEAAAPGAYPGDLTRRIIDQRIDFVLHNQEFERRGLTLDDAARDRALTVVFGDAAVAEESLAAFSDSFADQFLDDVARQIALQEELGQEGYSEWRAAAYADTPIEVSSRYGRWDRASSQVVAPTGPRPAPAADSPLEG